MGIILGLAAMAMAASSLSSVDLTPAGEKQVSIATADLDLTKRDDLARLERRIARAVTMVCPLDGPATLEQRAWANDCRAATASKVRPRIAYLVAKASGQDAALAAR